MKKTTSYGTISDIRQVSLDEIHKEHRNGFNQDKAIILWFPGQAEQLPSEVIETYFDKLDGCYHPVLH